MLSCYIMAAVSSLARAVELAESLMRLSSAVHNYSFTRHRLDVLDFTH